MPTNSDTEDFLNRTLADIIDEVKRLRAQKTSLRASNNALRRKISAQHFLPDTYASQLAETKSFLRTVISALANTLREDQKQKLANLVRAIRVDMCVVLTHCAEVVREDFEYILAQCRRLLSFVCISHHEFAFHSYDFGCRETPTSPTAFNPTWTLDLRHGRAGSLLARSLSDRLLTLHLDLTTYEGSFQPLALLLSSAPCLSSLELGRMSPSGPNDTLSPLPDLSFPALEILSVYCDVQPFVKYVTTQWTMPRLASLTCIAPDRIPVPLLDAHGKQLTHLHFMCAADPPPHHPEANTVLLPRLHELCPRIAHLALPVVPAERAALDIRSPTLRYLDICSRPVVAAYRAIALAPTACAPQLRTVRMVLDVHAFVPRYLHPADLPGADSDRAGALEDVSHMPWAQDADSDADSDADTDADARADWLLATAGGIVADFPGCRMRQHSWAVALDGLSCGMVPPRAAGEEGEKEEDDDDDEYEYESRAPSPTDEDTGGSGDEGGDWESDSDSGSDSDMERGWTDDPPGRPLAMFAFSDDLLDSSGRRYDREAVLARFSQSQRGDFLLE
ncbi:hypothetical protein V8D89_009805 [Ganoderma adspersum]